MNNIIIITGVSGSGKTTLQKGLLEKGFKRPINFTTRNKRGDEELDEYVFLSKKQFFKKMENGDFLETTNYNGNFYGVSNNIGDGNYCIVLDPVGREQALEKLSRVGYKGRIFLVFLKISEKTQKERLKRRGGDEESIKERIRDFEWFYPHILSIVLDGEENINDLITKCENLVKT